MSNSLYSVDQEFTSKLSIPFSNFKEVDAYDNIFFIRFRISTEDRNISSYWSPVYSVDSDFLYENGTSQVPGKINLEKIGANSVDLSWDEVVVYKGSKDLEVGVIENYDVWIRWSGSSLANPSDWIYKERIGTTSNNILIPEHYPYPVSSNATGGTTLTIETSLTIPINLQGQKIIFTAGKGEGNENTIQSNTIGSNSTITLKSNFQHENSSSTPDVTTVFQINNYGEPEELFVEVYRPGRLALRHEGSLSIDQTLSAKATKEYGVVESAGLSFLNSHGYATGSSVVYSSDNPMIVPGAGLLASGQTYYIRSDESNKIALYPTKTDAEENTNQIFLAPRSDISVSVGYLIGKRLLAYEGSLLTL